MSPAVTIHYICLVCVNIAANEDKEPGIVLDGLTEGRPGPVHFVGSVHPESMCSSSECWCVFVEYVIQGSDISFTLVLIPFQTAFLEPRL